MRAPALRYKAYSASALAIKVEGFHLLSIIEIRGPEEMILSNQGIGDVSRSFLHYFPLQSQSWLGNPRSSEQREIEWGLEMPFEGGLSWNPQGHVFHPQHRVGIHVLPTLRRGDWQRIGRHSQ